MASLSPGWAAALLLCLLVLPALAAADSPAQADFYVASGGDDGWSGTRATPNRGHTDGPFATVERARQAVRALLAREPSRDRPLVVRLRGGTYFLDAPLVFTPEDSGVSASAPVVYAAYGNEKPVLSGGRRITGWERGAGGRWQARIPTAWNFAQLFVGGQRRFRPRLPKSGYYLIADAAPPSPEAEGQGYDRFHYRQGDLRSDWANRDDIEILAFNIWTMPRFHIRALDADKRLLTLKGRTRSGSSWAALPRGNRYLVENVREALNAPGEWYLDRSVGVLTYLPRPGEDPDKTVVVAPRLERIVELRGDVTGRRWVQHLQFRDLAFAHANWTLPPEGHATPQAEVTVGGAITAEGARACVWERCRVSQIGTYAIELGRACRGNRIADCELTDLGAGGVKIGTTGNESDEALIAGHNTVENCLIAHGGRMHPAAVGVWIGHSPYNKILHNTIHDLYYTGISPGWSWGYNPSGAHHNEIAYNHIFDIGQGVLSDMGGIYTLGVSPGTILHHNLIHDVQSLTYGGWGIYFDEGTTGVVARDNVVFRTKSAGFHQHYGKDNLVTNNVFAFGGEAQLMRTRAEDHLSFTIERNIVLYQDAPLLGSNWSGNTNNFRLDNNLYWNVGGQPVTFAGKTLEEWQKQGQDVHSLIADPLFVDPGRGDFRLRPGSPATKIGFQPIDLSRTGRQTGGRERITTMPRAFPPPPPPQPIAEDFESVAVGDKAPGATTNEENAEATIRVTEETAATGRRSLKFIDAPGQQHNYSPHMYYSPTFSTGTLVGRFALRVEPGAVLYHEWRDSASPYHVGPSLRVDASGALYANGRPLTLLPHRTWLRFEITCGLGEQATGTYDLVVRFPGRTAPLRYPGLPCGSREMRGLRWFGFVADGTEAGVFYVDDIELRLR